MKETAIRIEGLGKEFRIGHRRDGYRTLRDTLADTFTAPFRRAARVFSGQSVAHSGKDELFWALQDVSFEIKQGELVGVIGRNGAGKSTLLKILSRITPPTTGFAEIHGRVGSLLEVGTGFHAELTGRENIFLNGAILGMKQAEIKRKFDEIVSFAEVERFIDTPVKHYSSGMYLRLAFGVAAHLEPEILIVDEVLAVGDAQFQKKCLNKMQDVGQLGRTVLFVSHNLQAITRLCERVILLHEGRVLRDGSAQEVVTSYLASGLAKTAVRQWHDPAKMPANEFVRIRGVRVRNQEGRATEAMDIREPVGIEIEYEVLRPGQVIKPAFGFENEEGLCLFVTADRDPAWHKTPRAVGCYTSTAWIPGNFLAEGTVTVGASLMTPDLCHVHCEVAEAVCFQVIDTQEGDSVRGECPRSWVGAVRPRLDWTTQCQHDAMRERTSVLR